MLTIKVNHISRFGRKTRTEGSRLIYYIGRPSKLGNPYSIREYGRQECLNRFEADKEVAGIHIYFYLTLMAHKLDTVDLVCYCYTQTNTTKHHHHCHGDIIRDRVEALHMLYDKSSDTFSDLEATKAKVLPHIAEFLSYAHSHIGDYHANLEPSSH